MLPLSWLIAELEMRSQHGQQRVCRRRGPRRRQARSPKLHAERLEERALLTAVWDGFPRQATSMVSTGQDVAAVFEVPASVAADQTGSIRGQSFNDVDADGHRDPGEPGQNGWAIDLYDGHGVLVATQVTKSADLNGDGRIDAQSEQGLYRFDDLEPGTYRATELARQGFEQTYPDPRSGTLLFLAASRFPTGGGAISVVSADLDGDGGQDLATANADSSEVSVLLNHGDGTFAAAADFGVGDEPYSLTAADFDGDGDPDLAAANYGSNDISVLLNHGDGTFAAAVNFAAGLGPLAVTPADLDGDGDVDLATVNGINVSVLLNHGDGTFAAPSGVDAGQLPYWATCADLDGDRDLDLAVANYGSHDVSVLLNRGDGTFATATHFATGHHPTSVLSADLDSDGDMDLATSNSGSADVSVLLNHGDATFAAAVNFAARLGPISVASADWDGDGDLDLAVANYGLNDVSVMLNHGDGEFAAAVSFAVGSNPYSLTSADLNGDGDVDFATANFDSYDVSVLLNVSDYGDHRIVLGAGQTIAGQDFGNVTTRHWQNPVNPLDVNNDLVVNALDALLCINAMNRYGFGDLPIRDSASTRPPFPDTDGNGRVEPIDALRVINRLNRLFRHQPALLLRLANDTGTGAYDLLTGDPTVRGRVLQQPVGSALYVGLDGMGAAQRVAYTGGIDADGFFTLTPAFLNTLAGGTLAEGTHTVDVELRSAAGAALTLHTIEFVLDDAYALASALSSVSVARR